MTIPLQPCLMAGKSQFRGKKKISKQSRTVHPTNPYRVVHDPLSEPVPERGLATNATKYFACPFCPEKFGREVMVALSYMPSHLPKFHPGKASKYPPGLRRRIALYRKSVRLAAKEREAKIRPSIKSRTSRTAKERAAKIQPSTKSRTAYPRICKSQTR